jgi:hypothetical protein
VRLKCGQAPDLVHEVDDSAVHFKCPSRFGTGRCTFKTGEQRHELDPQCIDWEDKT